MAHASTAPDLLIRAGAIYSMAPDRASSRAIAIRDEWIIAVSDDPHGLDALATPATRVVDNAELTLLPAFFDTHNHLFEAVLNALLVPVERARSIAEFVELIRQAAGKVPAGQWIRTTNAWNQANLAEQRPPTALELDAATPDHPVFAQRGGHLACVNSRALQLAGITIDTADPPGGTIQRLPDGTPSGILEGGAVMLVSKLLPPPVFEDQVGAIRTVCQQYNALGIGAVRAPMITTDQMLVYQAAWERGWLTVRTQPLINVLPFGPSSSGSHPSRSGAFVAALATTGCAFGGSSSSSTAGRKGRRSTNPSRAIQRHMGTSTGTQTRCSRSPTRR
jgi:predicted amidohydrolase YtcJ